jgi:transposase-like protein
MAKGRRRRKQYTAAQRSQVLAAAQKEGLTAAQVKRRFGVTPVTYYSWRKKTGVTRLRRAVVGRALIARGPRRIGGNLTDQVQNEVRARVQQILPVIVRNEVNQYLNAVLASGRGGRRRRA